MCEAEVRAGVDTELTTDFFVGYNLVFVIFLLKCGVVWQSRYTLDTTYLVQYRIEIDKTNAEGKGILREISQPVVADHRAKFSCCGQKFRSGPASHFLPYFAVVNLICVFLNISLNLVKNCVGVT